MGRYFETLQTFCFSSYFCPLILVPISGSFIDTILSVIFAPCSVSLFSVPSTFTDWNSVRQSYPFTNISVFSYLFITVWTNGYLFYSISYNISLSLFILLLNLFYLWHYKLLQAGSCVLWHPIFLKHFFTFWYHKIFQANVFFIPSPGINHCSSELWFLLFENDV